MADDKTPSKAFSSRYKTAKEWRDSAEPFLREILSFICPGREHDFTDTAYKIRDDDPETFISLPEDLATDFAADLVTYFTPAEATWTEYLITAPVPEEQAKEVMELVDAREEKIMDLITGSNYNDVAPQVMFEAAHGTVAMWVDKGHMAQPMFVETVPPHELLITPGHNGVLDRFREKYVASESLAALFDGWEVDLSDASLQRKMEKPDTKSKVCWGFWADWKDPGFPVWRCEITVDGKRITPPDQIVLGSLAGTCPLLVGRFNPQVGKPWGRGPAWKALPDMRVYNAVDEAVLDGMDQALKNTLIYADDGFLDMSDGLEPGRAYAASRGFTRDQVYEMQRGANVDAGYFTEERLEERLRSRFYQDGPRQRGDTPPTASQWLDERRRVQVRLGKPSAPLWTEFFMPFIQRVEVIAAQSGMIDGPITLNGSALTILPISPLQKAQNHDKVMVTRSNIELAAGVFGEALPQVIDMQATMQNVIEASGDELTVVAKQEEAPIAPPPAQ